MAEAGSRVSSRRSTRSTPSATRRAARRTAASRPVRGASSGADGTGGIAFRTSRTPTGRSPQNGEWAEGSSTRWQARGAKCRPRSAAGRRRRRNLRPSGTIRDCLDPSRPGRSSAAIARRPKTTSTSAVAVCRDRCRRLANAARRANARDVLGRVAEELPRRRGDLMGAVLAEGGKTLAEADPEVSEAVDFCRVLRAHARDDFTNLPRPDGAAARGVVVVVPPWNFPIAIPCGGVAAALAAGNTVILKPASDTVLIAWELCQCFWRGGVSRSALQFVPCSGADAASELVSITTASTPCILTGGTETALRMLARQAATAPARRDGRQERDDRHRARRPRPGDQARAALGLQPQRPEVLGHVAVILEAEVYRRPEVPRDALRCGARACTSARPGSCHTKIGPLIRPPSGDLGTRAQGARAGRIVGGRCRGCTSTTIRTW